MIISMIVAVGNNNEIGLNNQMLWHIKEDFKHFKETTMGHHMIMGRKTFESIGKALPGRTTIILTRDTSYKVDDDKVVIVHTIEDALDVAKSSGDNECFIAGGANIYEQFMNIASKIYLSKVDYFGEADTYFPNIDNSIWKNETLVNEFAATEKSLGWKLVVLTR